MRQLLPFLALSLPCLAQVTTGEIRGTVQDPSGAVVPGARATALNLETNAIHEASTQDDGRFRIPQLPVGSYEVSVEKSGLARYVQGPIVLRLNQIADLDVKMALAEAMGTLTVNADASVINTVNAEVGVNFDRNRISELPMAPDPERADAGAVGSGRQPAPDRAE